MNIKKEIATGVFWSAISKYSGIFVSLIISAILARLLKPEDFGVIAIATVSINFLSIFSDIGIGTAIIQNSTLNDEDYDELFTLTLYIGIILLIISFFFSFYIAEFYKNSELSLICKILGVNILFASLNTIPNALMIRNKRFKVIAKRTLFFQLLSGCVGIILAFNGFGALSLVLQSSFSCICIFLFNFYNYKRNISLKLRFNSIKRIFGFSLYQFLFSFFNYFSRNLDKLIIGKSLNMSDLGYYEKSYRLMMLPLENITFVINPVLLPTLSTLQDNKNELTKKNEKIISLISNLSFPLGLFLHFSAYEIINIYYGQNWNNSVPVFMILSLSIPLQMILSTIGSFYQAAGNTKIMFWGGLSNSFFTLSGFVISSLYFKTIEAIAWSWVITLSINFFISYYLLYRLTFKANFISIINCLRKPIINSIISYAFFLLIFNINISNNLWFMLFFKFVICFFITILLAYVSKQYNFSNLFQTIKNKLK